MPRIQFSDVVPPEKKRSIRNIPIPTGGNRKIPITIKPEKKTTKEDVAPLSSSFLKPTLPPETPKSDSVPKNNVYQYYYLKNKEDSNHYGDVEIKSKKKKFFFGTLIGAAVLIFIVGMMTVFASATIDVVPKSKDIDVSLKTVGFNTSEDGTVKYEVIKLTKTKTLSIPAAGEEAAEIKASGKIVIYNNFSTEPQRLIIRTRFESPEGLIFRIPESVVVPGKTVKGGVETPGSIEVEVFADEAGEKYNIKKSDFTIPGFKTDANRYKNLYARSSTAMTGGFVGKIKTVLPADKQVALQSIEADLKTDLEKELQSKIPKGLILLGNSILYKTKETTPKEESSSVLVGEEVTAYALMLDETDLSKEISKQYVSNLADWNNIRPVIKNFASLKIAEIPDGIESGGKIDLQINGKAKIWAEIDTAMINQKLLGAPKKDAAKLIEEFPSISSVTATIRPTWKQSFPTDPNKIHVKTTTNE